jgi:hypothetical protein
MIWQLALRADCLLTVYPPVVIGGGVHAGLGVVNVGQVSVYSAARIAMAAVGGGDTTAAMLTVAPRQAACSVR